MPNKTSRLFVDILQQHHEQILNEWLALQSEVGSLRSGRISESELRAESRRFLDAFRSAVGRAELEDVAGPGWAATRELLAEISANRALKGFTPSQAAAFVFSLKQPLFNRIIATPDVDTARAAGEAWTATTVLDRLGLLTTELFQKSREELIVRQQQELLELSTPVVELWEGILALPVIGTLDSQRTQMVMENLLQRRPVLPSWWRTAWATGSGRPSHRRRRCGSFAMRPSAA